MGLAIDAAAEAIRELDITKEEALAAVEQAFASPFDHLDTVTRNRVESMIDTAGALNYTGPNPTYNDEYLRGQAELICDTFPMDKEDVIAMIKAYVPEWDR